MKESKSLKNCDKCKKLVESHTLRYTQRGDLCKECRKLPVFLTSKEGL